jgi:hypothetical protein
MNVTISAASRRILAMLAVSATWSAAGAALAAPSISVSKVSNTATTMTIKVTGSGFSRNKSVLVEIDANGAFSGNLAQTFTTTADGNGRISVQKTKNLNASCLIGVFASDQTTGAETNGIDLSYGAPCTKASVTAHQLGSLGQDAAAVEFTVSHFTPNSSVTVELYDTATGQLVINDYTDGASGSFTTHYGLGYPNACNHVIQVTGIDDSTDFVTNTVSVKLCQ